MIVNSQASIVHNQSFSVPSLFAYSVIDMLCYNCRQKTLKRVLCQTVKTQMKCHITQPFISVYTVSRTRVNIYLIFSANEPTTDPSKF